MKKTTILLLSLFLFASFSCKQSKEVISFDSFGVQPNTAENASLDVAILIELLSA